MVILYRNFEIDLTKNPISGPRGWGSEEATQLLLNNLMYMTAQMSSQHSSELANLWRGLALAFPANLPALLNYLYVVVVLNHETLLSHVGIFFLEILFI